MVVYAFDNSASVFWRPYMYTYETLNQRSQGLEIRGRRPVITEDFGDQYARLNTTIESAVERLIDSSRRIRARSVTIDFDVYYTSDVVSVVLTARSRAVTDRTSVASVNFNPRNGTLVTLTEAVDIGQDIRPLLEGKIADMIRRNPARYYAAFNADPTGQAFYVTTSQVVVLFDEFQLSSSPGATTQISMNRNNIQSFTITPRDYHVSGGRYAVKMMPLRTVLEGLGYCGARDINFDRTINLVTISRNGRAIATFRPGENNFHRTGVLQRSLETAPVKIGNNVYVPISFFDQILNLTAYSIDSSGNITFIAYLG